MLLELYGVNLKVRWHILFPCSDRLPFVSSSFPTALNWLPPPHTVTQYGFMLLCVLPAWILVAIKKGDEGKLRCCLLQAHGHHHLQGQMLRHLCSLALWVTQPEQVSVFGKGRTWDFYVSLVQSTKLVRLYPWSGCECDFILLTDSNFD